MMHSRLGFFCCISIVFAGTWGCGSSASAGAVSNDSGVSSSTGCSDDLASEQAGTRGTAVPGSWGRIPAALQSLPPGATLCGSILSDGGSYGTVIITSLTGQALLDFYQPLMQKLGCPLSRSASSEFIFVCSDATVASVIANPAGYVLLGFG